MDAVLPYSESVPEWTSAAAYPKVMHLDLLQLGNSCAMHAVRLCHFGSEALASQQIKIWLCSMLYLHRDTRTGHRSCKLRVASQGADSSQHSAVHWCIPEPQRTTLL